MMSCLKYFGAVLLGSISATLVFAYPFLVSPTPPGEDAGIWENQRAKQKMLTVSNLPVEQDVQETSQDKDYYLASEQSFGFFDDIDSTSWKMHQERVRTEPLFMRPSSPGLRGKQTSENWLMGNVDPVFTCPHLRRVGGRGDGPKWVCDPHRLKKKQDCLVYSIGSKGEYNFEDALVATLGKRHCEIHVFDPNPAYARPNDPENNNIHYHAWGLKSSYRESGREFGGFTFVTFQETLKRLGHVGRRIDLFKVDCEGCEWTAYKDWLDESIDIRQIQMEIHARAPVRPPNVTLDEFFQDFMNRGFVPFFKEANNYVVRQGLCGNFYEYSFLRLHPSFFDTQ